MRLLLLASLAFSSCSLFGPDAQLTDLDAARQRWEAQRLTTYSYVADRLCFCAAELFPARIVVENGAVKGVHDPQTGEPLRLPDGRLALEAEPGAYRTIEGLFSLVEEAQRAEAERLDVTYHPTYGYPTEISIDYASEIADDEVTYTNTDFVALRRIDSGGL